MLTALMIGLSAAAQVQQGMAASAQAKSEQNMAEYNAKVAQQDAKAVEQKTALEQRRAAEEAERRQSSMLAGLGASGAVTTTGTPLLIQSKQAAEDELDNLMIGYSGATEARRLRSQAAGYGMEASIAGQRSKSAMTGAYMGAGTTLLTGYGRYKGWEGF